MKILINSIVFGLALNIGIGSTFFPQIENAFNSKCSVKYEQTFEQPLFTLREAKEMMGKKVLSKSKKFRANQIGRIIHIEMLGQDKFLVAVNWSKDINDKDYYLTFHGKNAFEDDLRIID